MKGFTVTTSDYGELRVKDIRGLSIEALADLHAALLEAGNAFERIGSLAKRNDTTHLLHGVDECFTEMRNNVVDEVTERVPSDETERRQRAFVMLDDAARCNHPDELPEALRELAGRL